MGKKPKNSKYASLDDERDDGINEINGGDFDSDHERDEKEDSESYSDIKDDVQESDDVELKLDENYNIDEEGDMNDSANQFTYDYCLVFNVGRDEEIEIRKGPIVVKTINERKHFYSTMDKMVKKLMSAGLKTYLYYSTDRQRVFCLIGASEERLEIEAERISFEVRLDSEEVLEQAYKLHSKLANATKQRKDGISETLWRNLYGRYRTNKDMKYLENIYHRYPEKFGKFHVSTMFKPVDRFKLLNSIFSANKKVGGCNLPLKNNIADKYNSLCAYYPLHSNRERTELEVAWHSPKNAFIQPIQKIRDYFGESIALYFSFISYYNKCLIIPALFGLVCWIWQLATPEIEPARPVPIFGCFMALSVTVVCELWKRKETEFSIKYGMVNAHKVESVRVGFKGEFKLSSINGKLEQQFSYKKKIMRLVLSYTIIWTLIAGMIGAVVGIFALRKLLATTKGGNTIVGVFSAIQIQIMNFIYNRIAKKLNDFENHKTEREYQDALILKNFFFKFVNSYNSLFYIAFIKKHDRGCNELGCIAELRTQLASIFITNTIIVNNAMEYLKPIIMKWWKKRSQRKHAEKTGIPLVEDYRKSTAEIDSELEHYYSTFYDFDELIINIGYVLLFIVAFPLAPLLALLGNVIEVRLDSSKLCHLTQRPKPRSASTIGTWNKLIQVIVTVSIVINVALIVFETEFGLNVVGCGAGDGKDPTCTNKRFLLFFAIEHCILIGKYAISKLVKDKAYESVQHIRRQEYIVDLVINGHKEDKDERRKLSEDYSKSQSFADHIADKPPSAHFMS